MKVIFLSKYGYQGASSRYRFYNYQKYFKNFDYEFMPLLSDHYIDELYNSKNSKLLLAFYKFWAILKRFFYLITASSDNLYVIEKELFPNVPYLIEYLLLFNKKYCLDYDDYVGASYSQNKIKKIFLANKLTRLVSKSKLTTVGNYWYFTIFKNHHSLEYLPTNIDFDKYKLHYKKDYINEQQDSFSIVWIGSQSTAKYLDLIKQAFFRLADKYNIELHIIGGIAPFQHENIKYIKWDENSEIRNIARCDMGIMPLYNTLWEKGKCGFKLIQYMGVGLPVIASPSPANLEIITNNGFICESDDDWYNKIELLILNEKLRYDLGKQSFARVEKFYSYEKWGMIYSKMITDQINISINSNV